MTTEPFFFLFSLVSRHGTGLPLSDQYPDLHARIVQPEGSIQSYDGLNWHWDWIWCWRIFPLWIYQYVHCKIRRSSSHIKTD